MAECVVDIKNIGVDKCAQILQLPRGILEAPPTFKFTAEEMADPALFKTAVEALIYGPEGNRGYLWPFATEFENASEAPVYQETPLTDLKVRNGKYRFRFFFAVGLCTHKAMFTHNAQGGKSAFYLYDIESGLYGFLDDATGDLYPFKAALNNLENIRISDGTVATASPLYIVLANSNDFNLHGGRVDGSVLEILQPLTDVKLTLVGTPIATSIVLDATVECDGTQVNGLDIGDFIKLGGGTISGVAEVNGRYTLTGTGYTAGTVDLAPPDALSVPGWASSGPVTITI